MKFSVTKEKLLGGLQQVFELRKVCVRIAVIDQRVEEFERFPHSHLAAIQGQELAALLLDEIEGLMAMIEAIKLADAGTRGFFVIAELLLRLFGIRPHQRRLGIAFLEEILPFLKIFQRRVSWVLRVRGCHINTNTGIDSFLSHKFKSAK